MFMLASVLCSNGDLSIAEGVAINNEKAVFIILILEFLLFVVWNVPY